MASIIEKYASEDVVLLQNPVICDGKMVFQDEIEAKGIVSGFSQADKTYFGQILHGKIFYVALISFFYSALFLHRVFFAEAMQRSRNFPAQAPPPPLRSGNAY